jgi:AcrR family transcriptional regulator
MESSGTGLVRPGLRERKKQQTRAKIERVALELFAERGFEHTTLADIAEAADVSKRTIFSYFESKEDIVFCGEPLLFRQFEQRLEQRPPGATTVDVLQELMLSFTSTLDDTELLRKKIVSRDPALRLSERARASRFEELIARSIAKDLDAPPGDVRPSLVAASMTASFTTVRDRLEAESGEPLTREQAMDVVSEVLAFVRGGLEGLKH